MRSFITKFSGIKTALTSASWPEAIILLIAGLVRSWRLDYHSVWFDEAVSLAWAGADPGYTWRITTRLVEEKHPPVYYLLLHYWQVVLGWFGLDHNDAALRWLGALLGVLTVLGILLLVRRLSGRSVARLAGLLTALVPIMVWYSQELRMFQPATTGLVWAAYCLVRGWQSASQGRRLPWWIAFVACMTAALYSYLFAAFLLPAAGLTLLAFLRLDRGPDGAWRMRRFGEGAVAVAVTGALFLPLVRNAWLVNSTEGTPGRAFQDFFANTGQLIRLFTIWRVDWPEPIVTAVVLFAALLTLAGLLLPQRTKGKKTGPPLARAFLILWLGIPLLIANLLLAQRDAVFAEDRYFLFLGPFMLWALARGVMVVSARRRGSAWVMGLIFIALFSASLPRLWTPAMYRENWRAAVEVITRYEEESAGLSGAAIAHVDYTRLAVEWYLRQSMTEEELPLFFPFGGTLTPDMTETIIAPPLEGLIDFGAETLWLTQSHLEGVDDQGLVEQWLNQRYPLVTEQYPAGVKLTGYALRSRFDVLPPLSDAAVYPAAESAPGLTLAACEVMTPRLSATDDALHPPSGWVHVRLWWQATNVIEDDYIATVQMIGPEGVWGDRLYRDNEALRRMPTSTWQTGAIMRDEIDVNLNPVTPPGDYPIVVGVMNSAGEVTGNTVECGRTQVIPNSSLSVFD